MRRSRLSKVGLALLIAVVLAFPAQAAKVSDSTIAKNAQALLTSTVGQSGPGMAVLVTRGNETLYRSARGSANVELGVPLTTDHAFHIASVTKMFVAGLVLKLSEQGALSLDDPVARYFPEFPNAGAITIRQLLNHTAGISDKISPRDRQPGFSRRDVEMATLVGEIAKRQPDFAPGTDQAYSNAGYILLGAVIEKATGKPWHAALRDEILVPLGLRRTVYGIASSVIPGRVAGYTSDAPDHAVSNAPFISMTTPASAGALVSTVDDLHAWMRALTSGRVIGEARYRQMITPAVPAGKIPANPYGFGMSVWQVRGETMVGHTGQISGFAAFLGYIASRDIIIVALGNNGHFDARTFGRRLAAIALGIPYPTAVSVPIAAADLEALTGTYRNETVIRTLSTANGLLYARRGNGPAIPLQMTREGRLHFVPDELSYFVPVRSGTGAVTALQYFEQGDGPPVTLLKIEESQGDTSRTGAR